MKNPLPKRQVQRGGPSSVREASVSPQGFSLVELVVVVAAIIIVAALVVPAIMQAVYGARLRATANDLAGIMQNARILAAKNNQTYDIKYTTISGDTVAYIDVAQNGAYTTGDPVVVFNRGVTPASGAPSGSGGQPSAYTLATDTTSGTPYDNTTTLAFNQRGLPCKYDSSTTPATCLTPASTYFVYYLNGAPGWSAVLVTKAGRTRVLVWNGGAWGS
jgi:type II secretory pathway pseudopilin PulG